MTKPSHLTPAATGDDKCCNHAQPLCSILSITPKAWPLQGLLLGAVALVLQGSLEASAQVSEVYCQKSCPLIAGVSLHEQAAGKDGLGH